MGSANCKEYVTTSKSNDSCSNQQNGTYQSTCEASMSEYTDPVTVCNAADIHENEMKQVDFVDDVKILLIKQNGEFKAVGNKCTHYGAPLHTGALGIGRVRCPWHGACFNINTGDIEDFPGLDSLPCYQVTVESDGQVKVRGKRKDLENSKRIKDMAKRSEDNGVCYVVIGGGPAGGVCVETLRQEGFTGRLVMLCQEQHLPYDRIKLSKDLNIDIERIRFRNAAFYQEYGVEAMVGISAIGLSTKDRTVTCSNGQTIKYDKVFLATGCRAARPPIKGANLKNVFTLRSYADSKQIAAQVNPEVRAVCLGGSFIATEIAAYLTGKVKSVTLVARDSVPFKPIFGEAIGDRFLRLFREKGIDMRMKSGITEIIGNADGAVSEVELVDGTKLPCDMLILGTGAIPNTDFLADSGIKLNANGSIDTDIHLMTSAPGVYAGGDIAHAPVLSIANERANIGHYQLAQYHGRIAAQNMVGRVADLYAVPFFFSTLFGKGVRFAGHGANHPKIFIDGDLEEFKFIAYYMDEAENVMATMSVGRDPLVSQFAELTSQGKKLHHSDIVGKIRTTDWTNMLQSVESQCGC